MANKKDAPVPEEEVKIPPSETEAEKNADARNADGGQGAAGSFVEEDKKSVTTEELKSSVQPLAPTHPLEVPKTTLADGFDTAEKAPEGLNP